MILTILQKKENKLETLMQTMRIQNRDIKMESCIEKCALLIIKYGKRQITEGIETSNKERIRMFGEKKYISIWKYWTQEPSNKLK